MSAHFDGGTSDAVKIGQLKRLEDTSRRSFELFEKQD